MTTAITALTATIATIATSQVRSDALSSASFLIAPPDPNRWQGNGFREMLGLPPHVLAPPLPNSREAKSAVRFGQRWADACAKMHEATADQALTLAQDASDTFFDRCRRQPKAKLPHLPEDLYDPGTKFMRAIELASRALFVSAADGTFPNVDLIEWLGNDLIAFHDAHADGHDARFQPVRAMGRCLHELTQILRKAD